MVIVKDRIDVDPYAVCVCYSHTVRVPYNHTVCVSVSVTVILPVSVCLYLLQSHCLYPLQSHRYPFRYNSRLHFTIRLQFCNITKFNKSFTCSKKNIVHIVKLYVRQKPTMEEKRSAGESSEGDQGGTRTQNQAQFVVNSTRKNCN